MHRLLRTGTAILVLALPSTAAAQENFAPYHYNPSNPAPGAAGRVPAARQMACRAWCVTDVTPCDPPEYKIADGRCQDPMWRY